MYFPQCCLRVLCFFEAIFISILGHFYFQDIEMGSFNLGHWRKRKKRGFNVSWEWSPIVVILKGIYWERPDGWKGLLAGEGRWQGGLSDPGEAGGWKFCHVASHLDSLPFNPCYSWIRIIPLMCPGWENSHGSPPWSSRHIYHDLPRVTCHSCHTALLSSFSLTFRKWYQIASEWFNRDDLESTLT